MPRWNIALVAALVGLTLALPASAQWKWRDSHGQTQYSDLPPPPGVSEKDILQRPAAGRRAATLPAAPASAAPLAAARASDPVLEAKRKQAEQEAAAKKKAEEDKIAAARAENCARARAQMRTLDSGIRIARVNDKGEREIIDDTARAAEVKRTQALIASECK